ncbi:hypothetical protein CI102_14940 [Trichoderma harzianum]|nr:hypothetical protein CI102_14940 [Trichoderma harzianum]
MPFKRAGLIQAPASTARLQRNSEAETLPGAMTLAESRRSPPRWVEWILSPRQTCSSDKRALSRSSSLVVFLSIGITQCSDICVNCTSTIEQDCKAKPNQWRKEARALKKHAKTWILKKGGEEKRATSGYARIITQNGADADGGEKQGSDKSKRWHFSGSIYQLKMRRGERGDTVGMQLAHCRAP